MVDIPILVIMMNRKSYSELIKLESFIERFEYLKIGGKIGDETFGFERYLNQIFYNSLDWKRFKRDIIVRDGACDLGIEGRDVIKGLVVHHINPITPQDIRLRSPALFDTENVITTTDQTHRAIHYGNEKLLMFDFVERTPYDTTPWKG